MYFRRKYDLISNIKGVEEKTALTIFADMSEVRCFKTSGQYVAFAGLSCVNGKSHISKIGSKKIRKVLYMSALSVIRPFCSENAVSRQGSKGHRCRYHEKTSPHFLRYAAENGKF